MSSRSRVGPLQAISRKRPASPAVVTQVNSYVAGTPVSFTTSGTLPTGLTAGQTYFVLSPTSTGYQLASTPPGTIAFGGLPAGTTAVATSGSQSGTQTVSTYLETTISYQGLTSPQSYATVLNIQGFQSVEGYLGLNIGDFVQGVTLTDGTNFTAFGYGVRDLSTPTGTPDQLVISDSQLATYGKAVDAKAMNGLQLHHNTIIVSGGNRYYRSRKRLCRGS